MNGEKNYTSWSEVRAMQMVIEASYGGFVVCVLAPAPVQTTGNLSVWMCQWSPSLAHVKHAWSRATTRYWPDTRYRTVPEMLVGALTELDLKLRREEEERRMRGDCRLRDIKVSPIWAEPQDTSKG